MAKINKCNLVNYIMEYEGGDLSDKDSIELFSHLLKTGLAWSLQGHYGRTATALIKSGYLSKTGKILKKI